MTGNQIFGPFLAMMLLTGIVWVVLYTRRLNYIFSQRIDSQQLTIPEKGAALIPEEVNWPSYNFRNLFELPVLFYALCLYLFVTGSVDAIFVGSAWAYVGLRTLHSLIHCTLNIVKLRFIAYMLSSIVLWFMFIRACWHYFGSAY
ncbi:MAG: MAPEG family protein [Woeseiaceae bacterium]